MNDIDKSGTNRNLWRSIAEFGISSPRERRNKQRFTGLCLVWALTLIGASWAMTFGELQSPASWLVALIPIALGIVTVLVYVRMLREMDEMMRQVQLEGLAFGFGVGVIFGTGYGLLELAGAPAWGNEPIAVMLFAWAAGQLLAIRRFR